MFTRKVSLEYLLSFSKKNKSLIFQFKNPKHHIGLLVFLSLYLFNPFLGVTQILHKFFLNSNERKKEILSYSFSLNQKRILCLLPYKNYHINSKKGINYKIILFNLFRYSLNYSLLTDIIKNFYKDEVKNNWHRFLNLLLLEPSLFALTKGSKKCIIANDHSIQNLYLIDFCRKNNIKVVYIQHAPVNNKFLPLTVDLALLYSQWAKDIYEKQGELREGIKVRIIGDIRISLLMEKNKNVAKDKSVLVCTNLLDKIPKVIEFCKFLEKKSYHVVIRNHPADRRNWKSYGFKLSQNTLSTDLNKSKFILVNESAVLLEAMAMKKLVYKCNFSKPIDNYGFKKNGILLEEFNSPEQLYDALINFRFSYRRKILTYYTGKIQPINEIIQNITKEIELL